MHIDLVACADAHNTGRMELYTYAQTRMSYCSYPII